MSKRPLKTMKVSSLIDRVNILCGLDSLSQEEKKGACMVLESFLNMTHNYRGYGQVQKSSQDPTVWDREREWDRRYFGGDNV